MILRRKPAHREEWLRPVMRLPISALLIFGLSGLMIAAVASVFILALWSGQQNTIDLARARAELIVTEVQGRVAALLDPAHEQAVFLSNLIAKQHIDPLHDHRFLDLAAGALAATPQVTAIAFAAPDGRLIRVYRSPLTGVESDMTDESREAAIRPALEASKTASGPYWGNIVWSNDLRQPLINLRAPVREQGRFAGVLFIVISVADLSASLSDLASQSQATAFILADHTHVLAHPNLAAGVPGLSAAEPMPDLDQVRDPILAQIWSRGSFEDRERSQLLLGPVGRIRHIGGQSYLFVYHATRRYSTKPWLIGTYLPETTLSAAMERMVTALIAGSAILVLAVLLAWLVGGLLNRRLVALAGAAKSVRSLEFGAARRLPRSRLRELDEAAAAFNAMLDGLRWFETYVPRSLVRRLIQLGQTGELQSVERRITVMFTDIDGFTTLSEQMGAGEVAAFLNSHFSILDHCIDGEGGTVDKYLGDGMMAFWGAPEIQEDHALRACRAALAIIAAVDAENARQKARGGIAIRLRIGIHTGPVTVGNIGGGSRMSYTIVGDTVNSAERLCELGKEVTPEGSAVVALVSGDTAAAAGAGFTFVSCGAHVLRGRQGGTEILRLVGPETGAADPAA